MLLLLPSPLFAEQVLLDLSTAVIAPLEEGDAGLKAGWTKLGDGAWRCRFKGAEGMRRRFLIRLPVDVQAEGEVRFHVRTENLDCNPGRANLALLLQRRTRVPEGTPKDLPLRRELPLFAAGGAHDELVGREHYSTRDGVYQAVGVVVEVQVRASGEGSLVLDDLRVTIGSNLPTAAEEDQILATPPTVSAALAPTPDGRLLLRVNDQALPALGVVASAAPKLAAAAGIRLQRMAVNLGGANPTWPAATPLWLAPDYFDFAGLDASLRAALATPDTVLVLDVILATPPRWWPGAGPVPPLPYTAPTPPAPPVIAWPCDLDPAIRAWRQEALRLLLTHLRAAPWRERVIGCYLVVGPADNLCPPPGREQHPAYRRAYGAWLRTQVPDDATLRTALRLDPAAAMADLLTVTAASDLRTHSNQDALDRDERDNWPLRFANESWTGTLLELAGTVKQFTQRRWLVGLSGGPAAALNDTWNSDVSAAPWGWPLLLASPDVDLLDVPPDRVDARPAVGSAGNTLLLAATARRHGKLLWTRADWSPLLAYLLPVTATSRARDDLQVARWQWAAGLAAGTGLWLAPVASSPQDSPAAVTEIRTWQAIIARTAALPAPASDPVDVAFVVDPQVARDWASSTETGPNPGAAELTAAAAIARLPVGRDAWHTARPPNRTWFAHELPRSAWPRAGLAAEVVSVDDFDPARYRLVIAAHVICFDAARRQRWQAAQNSGRVTVIAYPSALTDEFPYTEHRDERAAWRSAITGVDGSRAHTHSFAARPGATLAELARDIDAHEDRSMQPTGDWASTFPGEPVPAPLGWLTSPWEPTPGAATRACLGRGEVTDTQATALARYTKGAGADVAAIALRSHAEWTAVYSGSPVLNPALLRGLARLAKAQVYLTGDDWSAITGHFIVIHARAAGDRTLTLPQAEPLYELFSQRELAPAATHTLPLAAATTTLYFRGTRAQWEGQAEGAAKAP